MIGVNSRVKVVCKNCGNYNKTGIVTGIGKHGDFFWVRIDGFSYLYHYTEIATE